MESGHLNLVNASSIEDLPSSTDFCRWIDAATGSDNVATVDIRIVDSQESEQLNLQYRSKPGPTNVLAFPAAFPEQAGISLLGDLVLCAEIVAREATEQDKTPQAHWAHLVVHGCLHLLGMDHVDSQQALKMETRETEILDALGFAPPYDAPEVANRP